MKNFLSQVFNDLRARRLLPVAALLVAGLVAAPIVLEEGRGAAGAHVRRHAPRRSRSSQGPDELAEVKLEDEFGRATARR